MQLVMRQTEAGNTVLMNDNLMFLSCMVKYLLVHESIHNSVFVTTISKCSTHYTSFILLYMIAKMAGD